ncbi:TetR/AcrR family transcriptional regulator [Microbacterium resistens]|uniref:TetR/AcrR family transcriptional regulator n=1 Tax=Microbacterium resistens TaxID=156977 RepID=UPI001C596C62|nr:TetR/AcrR family transcriptional regulator [Microbacterium resistens]MBW1641049.1 TetR/AcrR family transcriptional regulator [Microbacterium resistens]
MDVIDRPTPPRRRGRPGGLTGPELLAVARDIFLREGYAATTMDAVAAGARISKQTLYRQHGTKEDLFSAVVADWVDRGRDAMKPHRERLLTGGDPRAALLDLATALQNGVLSDPVVRMRSLVISGAERLPAVAGDYVRRSWDRNESLLADALADLDARGVLDVPDPRTAARQFTWLVVGTPLDRATLTAGAARLSPEDLSVLAREGVETFLARYGR